MYEESARYLELGAEGMWMERWWRTGNIANLGKGITFGRRSGSDLRSG
jgi:hypothetical protein